MKVLALNPGLSDYKALHYRRGEREGERGKEGKDNVQDTRAKGADIIEGMSFLQNTLVAPKEKNV